MAEEIQKGIDRGIYVLKENISQNCIPSSVWSNFLQIYYKDSKKIVDEKAAVCRHCKVICFLGPRMGSTPLKDHACYVPSSVARTKQAKNQKRNLNENGRKNEINALINDCFILIFSALGIDCDGLDYLKKLQLIRAFLTNIPPVFTQLFFDGKSPEYRQSGFADKIEEALNIFLKPQNAIREVPVPSSMQMVKNDETIQLKLKLAFDSTSNEIEVIDVIENNKVMQLDRVKVIGSKLSEILHAEDNVNFTKQVIKEFSDQPLNSKSKKLKTAPTVFCSSILTGVIYKVTRTERTLRTPNQLSSGGPALPPMHLTFFFQISKHFEYRTLHSFPEGIIIDADIRINCIANYQIEEVVGKLAHDFMSKDDRPLVIAMQGLTLGQGVGSTGTASYELVANHRSIFLNTKGEVINYRNATGQVVTGILCTNSLITHEKYMEYKETMKYIVENSSSYLLRTLQQDA